MKIPEIERMLSVIKSYAGIQGADFAEYVDFCIYPSMIEDWLSKGMGISAIKKQVYHNFTEYEKQRKYLSSLA